MTTSFDVLLFLDIPPSRCRFRTECRHNIHIDRDSVQDSLHPHSGWIEKSRVGLEYMLKRRSTYGPSNDEGRRVDRRRRGEGPKMCCVISKISDARIWHRLTLHHSVCEPSKPSFSTLICLSGSARTERHWVTEPVVGYWALWYSTLSLSSWADGLFIETLH
jgi:hypothetical protein